MREIIIAYPVKDTALKLRAFFEQEGLCVSYVCALGSSALSIAQELREGVIVCAEMLSDMSAGNIAEHLPPDFDVVALTHGETESIMCNLIYLPLPVNREELVNTVSVLASSSVGFSKRNKSDNELIATAKSIVMKTMDMSEMQAHRYLQNKSMNTGKALAALSKEIINNFAK